MFFDAPRATSYILLTMDIDAEIKMYMEREGLSVCERKRKREGERERDRERRLEKVGHRVNQYKTKKYSQGAIGAFSFFAPK